MTSQPHQPAGDVSVAMQAKSDQLNAVDIVGFEPVITITAVDVLSSDQPVAVHYQGDNGRPWKPSKGMIRILAACWGKYSTEWVGRQAQLYYDPSVKWAGKEIGGIRIKALSGIPATGIKVPEQLNRQQRRVIHILALPDAPAAGYPQDKFEQTFPAMEAQLQSRAMTLPQVIAQLQKTGEPNPEQLARLQAATPPPLENQA